MVESTRSNSALQKDVESLKESMEQMQTQMRTMMETMMATTFALKQKGSVKDYSNQFYKSFSGMDISEEFRVKLFLAGLHEGIQSVVRKFNPKTLRLTVYIAELQERASILASKQDSLGQMEFKPSQNTHGNFVPPSLHQLNTTKLEPSSGDVTIGKNIVEECNELVKHSAISCEDSLLEIEPNLFDKIPLRKSIRDELQVFDESPRSDNIEKEPQTVEEMPTMKSLVTQNGNRSLNAYSYVLLNDSSIAGENWDVTDAKGAEFTTFPVLLKVFSVCDVEDSKEVVIKENSTMVAYIIYEPIFRFGRGVEDKDGHILTSIERTDLPLPPPEPPPFHPLI